MKQGLTALTLSICLGCAATAVAQSGQTNPAAPVEKAKPAVEAPAKAKQAQPPEPKPKPAKPEAAAERHVVAVSPLAESLRSAKASASDLGLVAKVELPADRKSYAQALAHFSAAEQADEKGDSRLAMHHYRAVLNSGFADAELTRRATELIMTHGESGEAERLLEALIQARPNEAAPRLRMIEFYDAYSPTEEAYIKADQLMTEALTAFPARLDVITSAVYRYLVQNRRVEAQNLLKSAVEKKGGDAVYWLSLATAAQETWLSDEAGSLQGEQRTMVNRFYAKALASATKAGDEQREMEVAQYYVLTQQLPEARKICEQLAARTGNLAARKILFRLYESENQADKALAVLESIVADDPQDVTQLRLLADTLEKRQDYTRAAETLESAIQIGTGSEGDYETVINLWLGLRQVDRAMTLITRANKLYPDNAGFYAQLAMAYRAKAENQQAVEAFREAEKMGNVSGAQAFNHRFHFYYGVALEQNKEYDEAAKQFHKSIDLAPGSEPEFLANTYNYLGYMWAENGTHLDEAEKLIKKALELEPSNPAYIDSMGWVLHKQGKHKEALAELQTAVGLIVNLQPEDAEIIEHIGIVQLALGNKKAARESFTQAKSLNTTDERIAKRIEDALKKLDQELPSTGGSEKSK